MNKLILCIHGKGGSAEEADSIGAYFTMISLNDRRIEKAFFISPVVNMEKLITDMMMWANVTEDDYSNPYFVWRKR